MLLIYFLFFYTSKISIFQYCLFSDCLIFLCSVVGQQGLGMGTTLPFLFPSLLEHTEHTGYCSSNSFWSSRHVSGSPRFEWLHLSVVLPWPSLSASTDSIFLCFVAQDHEDNSSSEDLNSLLLRSVNKSTVKGKNHFPTSFFPLPPFKYKIEAPRIAYLCRYHATTSSPDL